MTHRAEITLPEYKLLDHPRVGRTGGGIALLFRENIQAKRVDSGERKSFEFSECTAQQIKIAVNYCISYPLFHCSSYLCKCIPGRIFRLRRISYHVIRTPANRWKFQSARQHPKRSQCF